MMRRGWWLMLMAGLALLVACAGTESVQPETEPAEISGPAFIHFYTDG